MNDIKFMKLDFDIEGYGENDLELKKTFSRLIAQSRKRAKGNKCVYCNEEKTSFCNSHSVPAFCLRNIATNGEVYYFNTLVEFPVLDKKKGVSNAGTFQLICRECDSKIFEAYENPENYRKEFTPKMLAQITMKNYLKSISKKQNEGAMWDIILETYGLDSTIISMKEIQEKDLAQYIKNFQKSKRLSNKNWGNEYYQFYTEKLNYVVPMAFQGNIALVSDLDGQIINGTYNKDINYRFQDLHICIFPLKESSIVTMFIDSNDRRYRNFYKKFNKLSHNDKLSLINYIVFLHSEEIFLSKNIPREILQDNKLIEVSRKTSIFHTNNIFHNFNKALRKEFDLSRMNEIPNLLSEKYKLR